MADIDDKGFFGHPKGLRVLFFTEMWERFSFYGMRALLVLYMIGALEYSEKGSHAIYAAYGSLVYAFPVIGGWIANRWIGYRNSIILGAVMMSLGHFAMAIENETFFFLAMALLCVGNGFFKPNISSTVGRLYEPGDPRRDRGFTIFYMAINLGALLSPLVCGKLGESYGWHWGFGAAGVGMIIGLVWFLAGQKHIGHHGAPDDPDLCYRPVVLGLNRLVLVWVGALMIVPGAAYAMKHAEIAKYIIFAVGAGVLFYLIGFVLALQGRARLRLLALMMLMVFHMLFFAGFEQAGSSFSVLTKNHVDRELLGMTFEASMFQSVNPTFIVLLAPLFALLWRVLHRKDKNPSIPLKFAFGLIQLGLGFWILTIGLSRAELNSDGVAIMGLGWLVLCYFLHTTGELWISPIGLSAVTKLAPRKWVGFCMGAWFLTISFGFVLGGEISKLTARGADEALTGMAQVERYGAVFENVALFALGAGAFLLVLSPFIKKLIAEDKMGTDEEENDLPKAKAKVTKKD